MGPESSIREWKDSGCKEAGACQAPCRPRAERASFLGRFALQEELHFSTSLIQEFCENEAVLIQKMAIGISVQFNAVIQCSHIRYTEYFLGTISVQNFGEYREEYDPAPWPQGAQAWQRNVCPVGREGREPKPRAASSKDEGVEVADLSFWPCLPSWLCGLTLWTFSFFVW